MYRVCLCVSIMYVVKKTFNGFSFSFYFEKPFLLCVCGCVCRCVFGSAKRRHFFVLDASPHQAYGCCGCGMWHATLTTPTPYMTKFLYVPPHYFSSPPPLHLLHFIHLSNCFFLNTNKRKFLLFTFFSSLLSTLSLFLSLLPSSLQQLSFPPGRFHLKLQDAPQTLNGIQIYIYSIQLVAMLYAFIKENSKKKVPYDILKIFKENKKHFQMRVHQKFPSNSK